ncbi:hypothetical protein BpHYR1_008766, partial [Brachionus plicatilis]
MNDFFNDLEIILPKNESWKKSKTCSGEILRNSHRFCRLLQQFCMKFHDVLSLVISSQGEFLWVTLVFSGVEELPRSHQQKTFPHKEKIFSTELTWLGQKLLSTNEKSSNGDFIPSTERTGKRGGGTMVLVRTDYTESITRLPAKPPIIKGWHTEKGRTKLGLLEFTKTRTRPHRLPRGYSCVLAVAVDIPEFNVSRLRSSISQLCHALEEP